MSRPLATQHRRPRRWALVALCLLAMAARAQPLPETQLKARLVLSLSRFAQWPGAGGSAEPLRLCVAQQDAAVAQVFAPLDGQVINGRRIQLVKAPPVAGCQVLFVDASAARAGELVRAAAGSATLTIGDGDGFIAQGGMVELVLVNDAMRFDVNLAAMRPVQMALSSQVLKLARQVRE